MSDTGTAAPGATRRLWFARDPRCGTAVAALTLVLWTTAYPRRPPDILIPVEARFWHGDREMCSVGGPMDVEYNERVKGKRFRCRDCGESFEGVGKHPVCPSCQSDAVDAV